VPFAATDFHTLALWLIQNRTDEASLRTAISRVYYAGHLLAVQRLMTRGWEPKGTGEDHRGVIRELRRGRTRHLADKLTLLLELREHADYHLEAADMDRNTEGQLSVSEREELEALVELSETISLLRVQALHVLGRDHGRHETTRKGCGDGACVQG